MAPSTPATTSLVDLPPELVTHVITESLPEGFESLALSCKAIHELCKPFIEHHNLLRAQFREFEYTRSLSPEDSPEDFPEDSPELVPQNPLWRPIPHSYALIERIATEPVVVRYIQHADLSREEHYAASHPISGGSSPALALFANSPYLRQAGLDWREYFKLVAEDYNTASPARPFSQHGTVFVLTLLPNVKSLKLHGLQNPTSSSDDLLNIVVSKAKQSYTTSQYNASLAQVIRFESTALWNETIAGAPRISPFLTLPKVRWFEGPITEARRSPSAPVDVVWGEKLESAFVWSYPDEEVAMGEFLRIARRLRNLVYFTRKVVGFEDWDICKFLRTVACAAGARLERLSISSTLILNVIPDQTSLHNFRCLRELLLPLEFFVDIVSQAASRIEKSVRDLTDSDVEALEVRLGDLLPDSVTHFGLQSNGDGPHHKMVLHVLFHGFGAMKATRLPVLEKIVFDYPPAEPWRYSEYRRERERLVSEIESTGVVLDPNGTFCYSSEWYG